MYTRSESFLQEFHRKFPSCSSVNFTLGFTNQGLTSYDLLVECIKEQRGALLDLACGDGYLLILFAKSRMNNENLFGVDISEGELEVAWQQTALKPQQILKANARALPFAPECIEGVTCHMAFMLMPKVDEIIAEIYRVLKPGGIFAAIIPAEPVLDEPRQIYRDWLSRNIDAATLMSLKALGDSRVSSKEELKKLFNDFSDFNLELHEVIYDITPVQMVNHFSQCYASGLISDQDQERLKKDLLSSYQELGKEHLRHRFPVYLLKAQK